MKIPVGLVHFRSAVEIPFLVGHLTLQINAIVFSQNKWIFLYRICLIIHCWKETFHITGACPCKNLLSLVCHLEKIQFVCILD